MKKGVMICCPLDMDDFGIPNEFVSSAGRRIYLIPEYLLENLLKKLDMKEYCCYKTTSFVERHLRLIEYFINSEQTYFKNIKDICAGTNGMGYKVHLEILKGCIVGRDKYQPNSHPFNYKLHTNVKKWQWVFFDNSKVRETMVKSSLDSGHALSNEMFMSTLRHATLDLHAVVEAEYWHCLNNKMDSTRLLKRLQKAIAFLYAARSVTKGKIVDRVYSSFTSMTSVSRRLITYDKRYFTELDISNCQPLLLIALLEINNLSYDSDYLKDVISGTFYNRMRDLALTNNLLYEDIYEVELKRKERYSLIDDIKMLCFRMIFFNKNKKPQRSSTLTVFSNLYPKTYESLIALRPGKDQPTIAKRLQDLEAEVMLSVVPGCPYFPVHDGLYCLEEDQIPRLKQEIQLNFNRICGKNLGEIQFKVKKGGLDVKSPLPIVKPRTFSFAKRRSLRHEGESHSI